MQISFSCPNCGKTFEVPLSLAGKKGRCKKCGNDFRIPAPVDTARPGSSEAIPVVNDPAEDADDGYALAAPEPVASPTPPAPRPRTAAPSAGSTAKSTPARTAKPQSRPKPKASSTDELGPRPWWFVPAVIGGSSAVVFGVNVAVLAIAVASFSFPSVKPVEVAEFRPPVVAKVANVPTTESTRPAAQPAPATLEVAPAQPLAPNRPPALASLPDQEASDRVMNSSDIVARYEASVALIKGRKGSGTGFIVKPGIVATNAHVIDGERVKDIEVRFPSAEKSKQGPIAAKLLFQDRDRDLALLGVETDLKPVRIADAYKFIKGEDVTVIGNPGVGGQLILENAISRGIVSSQTKLNNHAFLQLSISINPGNSGGPVFDAKGRVIGVVTLKTTRQEGLAFAIPVEDLSAAIETAESSSTSKPAGSAGLASGARPAEPDVVGGNAPKLAYAWKQGQTYVYGFEMTIDTGSTVVALKGSSIYRVKSVDSDGITLGHRGWYVRTKRSADGMVLPNGVESPQSTNEIELKIDPQGEILMASGSSPLPLVGDLSMLVIEPLPDDPERSWEDSRTIVLSEVEQGAGGGVPRLGRSGPTSSRSRITPRGRSAPRLGNRPVQPQPSAPNVKVTTYEATEETRYTLGPQTGDAAPIRKQYELSTKELVGNDPRLSMIGQGTISFDIKAGVPLALDYSLKVVESTSNATFRLPVKVSCKLLNGKESAEAVRVPVYTPTAMNPIDAEDVSRLFIDLKSADVGRRRQAIQVFYSSAPIEKSRSEVARVLEKMANDKDGGIRSDVIRALGIWGDRKSVDFLAALLPDESFSAREELFEALVRVSPTESTAELFIGWLIKDVHRAWKALKAIGPAAEGPLLRTAEEGTNLEIRMRSLEVLKEVGTSQSIPALQKMVEWKEAGEIGRHAVESIRSIKVRWPADEELANLINQLRSTNGRKRREAVERFSRIALREAFRADVARGLEELLGDADDGVKSLAVRALGVWGTTDSRAAIARLIENPDYRSPREAIELLSGLGGDETSARAIASQLKKDRRIAIEALTEMGSIAEPAVIEALENAGDDRFLRNDLYKLLGKIGTAASQPVLKAAAEKNGRDAQNALQELESRVVSNGRSGGPSLTLALDDLKSGDHGNRKQSLEILAAIAPIDVKRAEVSRVLELVWDQPDFGTSRLLREVVIRWADPKTPDFLARRLADHNARQWDDSMRALVTLRPDEKTGELLFSKLGQKWELVMELSKKLPPGMTDRQLLAIFQKETDQRRKIDACKALGNLGSPATINDLQALSKRSGDTDLAARAEDALRNITARQ